MFQALLGASMATITDRVVPLEQVLGASARPWACAIDGAREPEDKVALTRALLTRLLSTPSLRLERIRDLVECIAFDRSILRVDDIARASDLDTPIVQDAPSSLAAWLGIVHLLEGDASNARYWYGQAGRRFPIASGGGRRGRGGPHEAVYALPAFDELLVGYTDRSAALDPAVANRVSGGGAIKRVVVGAGRVLATWKRRIEGREVTCLLTPFAPLGRRKARATTAALHGDARFLGLDLRWDA